MPRRRNPVPSYRLHKPTGQAVVTISSPAGRRDTYLGLLGSPESKAEYARIVAEFQATPSAPLTVGPRPPAPTVNKVLLAFMAHADRHYRDPDGQVTRELNEFRQAVKLIRGLYGYAHAKDFGPLALKAVRNKMVAAGWCRGLVNRRVGRVKRMFKWAASGEIIPATAARALAAVAGLRGGKADAPETPPVDPVPDAAVRATLPLLPPQVGAMIELQRLTGMRPGEVCRLRPCEVDPTGTVWLYRPPRHKSAWRGKGRVILIGPKAQAVLKPYWPADPDTHVFSARRTVEEFHAARAAARKTPKYASHMTRNAAKRTSAPKRGAADRYTTTAYGYAHAVGRACGRAGMPGWHPNQLRHKFATEVRSKYGLEAAQVLLGHSRADVTQVYAERDLGLAVRVAREVG